MSTIKEIKENSEPWFLEVRLMGQSNTTPSGGVEVTPMKLIVPATQEVNSRFVDINKEVVPAEILNLLVETHNPTYLYRNPGERIYAFNMFDNATGGSKRLKDFINKIRELVPHAEYFRIISDHKQEEE